MIEVRRENFSGMALRGEEDAFMLKSGMMPRYDKPNTHAQYVRSVRKSYELGTYLVLVDTRDI